MTVGRMEMADEARKAKPATVSGQQSPGQTSTLTLEMIAGWFREAHPKLRKLPAGAVQPLLDALVPTLPPGVLDSPAFATVARRMAEAAARSSRIRAAWEAVQDARRAARDLRAALGKVQRVYAAESEGCPDIDAIFAALDCCKLIRPPRRQGAPEAGWPFTVTMFGEVIERILNANGFPRASITSDTGPAAKVMARLLGHEGSKVAPATIARNVRDFQAQETRRNLSLVSPDSGGTEKPHPPVASRAYRRVAKEEG